MSDREAIISGLRQLADLLQKVPELPAPPTGHLGWVILGGDDEGIPAYEQAVKALDARDVAHTAFEDNGHLVVGLTLDGVHARIAYVRASTMAEYRARLSYKDNVQTGQPATARGEDGGEAA